MPDRSIPVKNCWFENIPPFTLDAAAVEALPPRPWIIPGILMRGCTHEFSDTEMLRMLAVIGANGKASYPLREPTKCLLINFQYDQLELEQRVGLAFKRYSADFTVARDRVSILSGWDHPFKLLIRSDSGDLIETPMVEQLIDFVNSAGIGVVTLYPLANMHEADENRGSEMRRVADVLCKIAMQTNAAVIMDPHPETLARPRWIAEESAYAKIEKWKRKGSHAT